MACPCGCDRNPAAGDECTCTSALDVDAGCPVHGNPGLPPRPVHYTPEEPDQPACEAGEDGARMLGTLNRQQVTCQQCRATFDDKARDALEAIRQRNEQRIVRAKYTEWTVNHEPAGDVRRLLSALGEALDAHPVSVAADGQKHCPRCAWAIGERVPLDQCYLRQAILTGLLAEAERFHAAIAAELAQ